MIFHRLVHSNQRGVTLIELLLAVAITGIVTGGITMTFFQVLTGNARTSSHMTAIKQVQNAGYWISHDAKMAQDVDTDDDPGTPELELVTLTWTEWDNTAHQVTYDIVNGELKRTEGATETVVARYIDSTKTKCEMTGDKLILTVTATVTGSQERSETRVYEVIPRPLM